MRWTWLVAGVALGCAHPGVRTPPTFPLANAPDSVIAEGLRRADIVVLATPDSLVAEPMIAAGLSLGRSEAWWNARLTTEAVAKGKLSGAKRMDYGILPSWQTPPQPFRLSANQVMIQLSTRWETAPVVVGHRAVYFLKKCYNCVELPHRTPYRVSISPWFAILALIPDRWLDVQRLARVTGPGRGGAAPTVLMQQSPFAGTSH